MVERPNSTYIGIDDYYNYEEKFLDQTDQRIDEFLMQGRAALQNLQEQRSMMKVVSRGVFRIDLCILPLILMYTVMYSLLRLPALRRKSTAFLRT